MNVKRASAKFNKKGGTDKNPIELIAGVAALSLLPSLGTLAVAILDIYDSCSNESCVSSSC